MNNLQEIIIAIVALAITALFFRTLLSSLGQTWIQTFPQTATILLLPIITFIITKVISGNIALSLGMVGALSIVRFRNPVKSTQNIDDIANSALLLSKILEGNIFNYVLVSPNFEELRNLSVEFEKNPLVNYISLIK